MGALNINRITDPARYTPGQLARLEAHLKALAVALPANPTPADLRAGVATYLGTVLADEIASDPAGLNYAGAADDAAIAALMVTRVTNARFVPQTMLLKRISQVGNTITCRAENGSALELSKFVGAPGLSIRFYELTPTVALRGARVAQSGFLSDILIGLTSIPAAMTDDDLFRVEVRVGRVTPERLRALYRGIPLAPNAVIAQDITEAKI